MRAKPSSNSKVGFNILLNVLIYIQGTKTHYHFHQTHNSYLWYTMLCIICNHQFRL